MRKNLTLVALIPVVLISSLCSKNNPLHRITLYVSDSHAKIFTDLKKGDYTAVEAEAVLRKMAEKGERYCREIQNGKMEPAGFLNPIDSEALAPTLPRCRNWNSMTDIGTDYDFIKMNANSDREGQQGFDCYSVGFMQPYIMAANLKCARLNIVDADFRVIKAHLDFLNLARTRPQSDARALLNKIHTGFPATKSDKRTQRKKHLSLAELCGRNSETKCLHYLITFLEKFNKNMEVNLILTPLHEFSFLPDRKRLESVFYTSNAFDPNNTSESEFELFLRSLKTKSQNAESFIIYHQAAEKKFGIYKIGKLGQISTVCADRYLAAAESRFSEGHQRAQLEQPEAYQTYFDKKSLNHHNGSECSEKI